MPYCPAAARSSGEQRLNFTRIPGVTRSPGAPVRIPLVGGLTPPYGCRAVEWGRGGNPFERRGPPPVRGDGGGGSAPARSPGGFLECRARVRDVLSTDSATVTDHAAVRAMPLGEALDGAPMSRF